MRANQTRHNPLALRIDDRGIRRNRDVRSRTNTLYLPFLNNKRSFLDRWAIDRQKCCVGPSDRTGRFRLGMQSKCRLWERAARNGKSRSAKKFTSGIQRWMLLSWNGHGVVFRRTIIACFRRRRDSSTLFPRSSTELRITELRITELRIEVSFVLT